MSKRNQKPRIRVRTYSAAASTYVDAGHEVFVEKDGGIQAGFNDSEYVFRRR
jgi:alanine dehydrogenase